LVADRDLVIRSYRLCFELERRIHRIDRWRIPVPYGVPLRGVAYGAAALAAVLLFQRLPVSSELLGVLHPALRLVILPVAVAYALTRLRVDGRSAHAAALAWLRWRLNPSRVAAFRAAEPMEPRLLGDLAIGADEGSALYRRAVIRGPATVTTRCPARARARARKLELRQAGGVPLWRGKRIRLAEGQRLVVR
jgi:hypothetical protein